LSAMIPSKGVKVKHQEIRQQKEALQIT